MRILSFLGAAGLATASLAGCMADAATDTAEQPLVLGNEDWDQLPEFETSPAYHIGAGYGRAVAQLSLGCTGWLISDDILVTANHCRNNQTTLTAVFGSYGDAPGNDDLGLADAQARMVELGFPSSWVFGPNGPSEAALENFTCTFKSSEYTTSNRDLEYWQCAANTFTVNIPPFNRTRSFDVQPGHLYGHFNVKVGGQSEGDHIYLVTVNRRSNYIPSGQEAVLLSPNGVIYDADDDHWSSYDHNFEFTGADSVCGSSGGVVIDESDNKAFGDIYGYYGDYDHCYYGEVHDSPIWSTNIGTYISSAAFAYTNENPWIDTLPQVGTHDSPWVGGTGGTLRTGSCPAGFLAGGVVSTTTSGVIGNFGIVCVPFQRGHDNVGNDGFAGRQFDSATVIAGGSIDTGFHVATNEDFNTNIHEVLTAADARANQDLLMCPAGSYLSGMSVRRHNALISQIRFIECTELRRVIGSNWEILTESRTAQIAPPGPPSTSTDPIVDTRCNGNSFVNGLIGRSGYFLDGFRLACTQLYPLPATGPVPGPT